MEQQRKYPKFDGFYSIIKAEEDYSKNYNRISNYLKNFDLSNVEKKDRNVLVEIKKSFPPIMSRDSEFKLTKISNAELNQIPDDKLFVYLIHRYKYEIYPQKKILDEYPPYLQIEPTSICNFRCTFCYQKNKEFHSKSKGYMGHMDLDLFKRVVDLAENKVQMISIASRGEPTLYKNFVEMLDYCSNKFLVLKINTNASLLTEKKIHAILRNGVSTIVFSADAADAELYKKLRINGDLKKVKKKC